MSATRLESTLERAYLMQPQGCTLNMGRRQLKTVIKMLRAARVDEQHAIEG
ncbi:MAG: hypothetical protein QOJ02_1784 [Acidobacteriota bacterium]|jgi:hypothetical protein|nr:hypothetical protein [Acidobacteriota bacterium]